MAVKVVFTEEFVVGAGEEGEDGGEKAKEVGHESKIEFSASYLPLKHINNVLNGASYTVNNVLSFKNAWGFGK